MRSFDGLRRVLRPVRRPLTEADDEIRFHLEMRAQELIDSGMAPDDARALAVRYFGDIDAVRSTLGSMDSWENRHMSLRDWLEARAHDVRFALRTLRRFPAVTATVVITLALGVGANTTMFGIVDRLLLLPPAYLRDPARVHRVYVASTSRDGVEKFSMSFNYTRYRELAATTSSFDELAVSHWMATPVGAGDATQELTITGVSASLWRLFDAKPVVGRFFNDAEDAVPVGSPVAVISYEYWRKQLGGDAAALGSKINLGQSVFTIIGVAPPGFAAADLVPSVAFIPITAMAPEIFGGASPAYYTKYNSTWLTMLARRKPGVPTETATADMTQAYRQSYIANPNRGEPMDVARPRAVVSSILVDRGPQAGEQSKIVVWLFGVSIAVLLIACANVANLLLTEALRRRREIAVRIALGIGRGRLVGQLLIESLLRASLGAIAGIAVAQIGGAVLRRALIPDVAWHSAMPDARLILFASVVALATGIVVGLVPAFHALGGDVTANLKAGAREGSFRRSKLRLFLLVAQGALSVALLVGAGLFTRSLQNARTMRLGMDLDHVQIVQTHLRGLKLDSIQRADLHRRLADRARSLPDVARLATTMAPPFLFNIGEEIEVPGIDTAALKGSFYFEAVAGDYFQTMGTRIIRGRGITSKDAASAPSVIVVSEPMAERLWPGENPIGKCVKVGKRPAICRTVVGTVEEIQTNSLNGAEFHYYVAAEQYTPANIIVLRTKEPRLKSTEAIRRALQPLMPGGAFVTVQSLREIVDPKYGSWALGATMFSVFGALALVLASLGLYSVIAHDITQRRHELGVRMALGAHAADIVRLVVRDGILVSSVGLVCGLIIVGAGARWLAPLLFDLSPYDPTIIGGVIALLLLVAVVASALPARRASKVDPAIALRAD